jgi:hypothetical protein
MSIELSLGIDITGVAVDRREPGGGAVDNLLLETGDALLLETGDALLLE